MESTHDFFNRGFDQGFDSGFNAGYAKGYNRGLNDGRGETSRLSPVDFAEELVLSLLPEGAILPDLSAVDLLQRAIERSQEQTHELLTVDQVGERMIHALADGKGFSLSRLGDCEALILAQESVMNHDEMMRYASVLDYAGVPIPDMNARARLVETIRTADVVGVPIVRVGNFQPLLFKTFHALEINWRELPLSDSLVNYGLHARGYLQRAAKDARLLLVGNKVGPLAEALQQSGVRIAGTVTSVQGMKDLERVYDEIEKVQFDLAFIAAGVPATILTTWVARRLGRVAIDFGALVDELVAGTKAW